MSLRYLTACLIALCLSLPVLAFAQSQLPFWPTRDVTVVATISNPVNNATNSGPKTLQATMQYQSVKQRMRLTTDLAVAGQPVGYNIFDYKASKAITVMPAMRMYMESVNNKMSIMDALNDPNLQKEKAGTSTVAGLSCTIWKVKYKENSGTGCVTDDGVALSYEGNVPTGKNGETQKMTMIANSVKYEPLPDDLFTPPADYQLFAADKQLNMLKNMMKSMKH